MPQLKVLERLDHDYLLDEICQVIIVRQITALEVYQTTDRRGRIIGLDKAGREAVWKVYEKLLQMLKQKNQETWQQVRLKAEHIWSDTRNIPLYNAVVVDEAQDLDPCVIRLLVNLCKARFESDELSLTV